MDGIGRTCLGCQAELSSNARFCPKCGQPAGNAAPGPALGDPVPGGPGGPRPGPGGGPGLTVAVPPTAAPPSAGWDATATRPTFPARPYQAPLPPATRPQALPGPPQPGPPQSFESFRPYPPPVSQPMGPQRMGPQPVGPPPTGPPRQPPRRHDRRRGGSSLGLWVILLVLLVGGGVAEVLVAHPFSHPAASGTASTGTRAPASPAASGTGPAASPTTSSSAAPVTERQAATSVAAMLSRSVSDRAAIGGAALDVGDCGPNLNADPKVFDAAAGSRTSLLASLITLPGRAVLPPALISDLTSAWQASIAADQAYAQWANDEIAKTCVANDASDPGYQATVTPNANATRYKTAFAAEWNPIAAQYGLKQYQPAQLLAHR